MTYMYPCGPKRNEIALVVILGLVWKFEGVEGSGKVNECMLW